jgi:catechol 2,3-dioxygenase-like lactoylglutathione lyase family enzyme
MLKIDGVTHWSIPVNDLEESERFYRDLLGLEYRGRLGNSHMACFHVGGHDILLCERNEKLYRTPQQDNRLHHSFTLSPEEWEKAVRLFH